MKEGIEKPKTKDQRIRELENQFMGIEDDIAVLDTRIEESETALRAVHVRDSERNKEKQELRDLKIKRAAKKKELKEISEKLVREGVDISKIYESDENNT